MTARGRPRPTRARQASGSRVGLSPVTRNSDTSKPMPPAPTTATRRPATTRPVEDVGVGRDVGQVLPGDHGVARPHARRDHHRVEAGHGRGRGLAPEPQVDPAPRRHGLEPRHEAVELLLARDDAGEVELPADPGVPLEQRHGMAPLGRRQRGGEARRRRRPPRRCGVGRRSGRTTSSVSCGGARVDEAGRDLAREGVVEAGLVAGDAGRDLGRAALRRLERRSRGRRGRAAPSTRGRRRRARGSPRPPRAR